MPHDPPCLSWYRRIKRSPNYLLFLRRLLQWVHRAAHTGGVARLTRLLRRLSIVRLSRRVILFPCVWIRGSIIVPHCQYDDYGESKPIEV